MHLPSPFNWRGEVFPSEAVRQPLLVIPNGAELKEKSCNPMVLR